MKQLKTQTLWNSGADLVVAQLEAQGVNHIFGIPGAKIDKVFDSLVDSSIQLIPVRHEANAAFMAAAIGRLTGHAGVALVTSGPGCSNLVTGMVLPPAKAIRWWRSAGRLSAPTVPNRCIKAWTRWRCFAR